MPEDKSLGIVNFMDELSDPAFADLLRVESKFDRANALFKPSKRVVARPHSCDEKAWSKGEGKVTKIGFISQPSPFYAPDMVVAADLKQIPAARLQIRYFDHYDLCLRGESVPLSDLSGYCQFLLQAYDRLASRSDIVIANELAFPSFWPGLPAWQNALEDAKKASAEGTAVLRENYIDRTKVRQLRRRFEADLQRIAARHSCIIMPGTYHDWNTFENVMPIKFPAAEDAIEHIKRTAAVRAKEFVKVSRLREYPIYNYGKLRFAILVCSDAYDLNMFFHQLRSSSPREERPQIYFVPSFQKSKKSSHLRSYDRDNPIYAACSDLSWATGAIVVFVNQADANDVVTRAVFFAGTPVYEKMGPGQSVFSLDWKKFHSRVRSWDRDRTPLMRLLTKEARIH